MGGIAVVDGANVAWEETDEQGHPRVANLVAMRAELERHGYDPIVIIDASLHHDVDNPDHLEQLLSEGSVRQAPAETDADGFVLAIAEDRKAIVVSNDLFETYRSQHPWIEERRLPFMIVRGDVYLDPDPEER